MRQVISLSFGTVSQDELTITLYGERVFVRRFGAGGDFGRLCDLVRGYRGVADALVLNGLPLALRIDPSSHPYGYAAQLRVLAGSVPLTDGAILRDVLDRWLARCLSDDQPDLIAHRSTLFMQGLARWSMIQALASYAIPFVCADAPWLHPSWEQGVSLAHIQGRAALLAPLLARQMRPQPTRPVSKRLLKWADSVVGALPDVYSLHAHDLAGRVFILDACSHLQATDLVQRGARAVVAAAPGSGAQAVSAAEWEGVLAALQGGLPTSDDALAWLDRLAWEPEISSAPPQSRFAFVLHPLVAADVAHHPRFRFTRYLPAAFVERVAAYAPPLVVGRIRGVCSAATGQYAEGILITLGATPRQMLRRSPDFTYRKLRQAARLGERRGALVMGLGAFTSVVGDGGATVAQHSPIGITSGNSLSVVAAVESTRLALDVLGKRLDESRVMVIGATGSIGAGCARLLARRCGRLVLMGRRLDRLLVLARELRRDVPATEIDISLSSDRYAAQVDAVITATTDLRGRVLDIMQLKPGAVICDIAQPPNVRRVDAARRPDVLVVESGEIMLPGKVEMSFNIKLPPGMAYACLAETILLSFEQHGGDYTIGRSITLERIEEIERLMHKHGMQIAPLRSFGREVTPEDLARVWAG